VSANASAKRETCDAARWNPAREESAILRIRSLRHFRGQRVRQEIISLESDHEKISVSSDRKIPTAM